MTNSALAASEVKKNTQINQLFNQSTHQSMWMTDADTVVPLYL